LVQEIFLRVRSVWTDEGKLMDNSDKSYRTLSFCFGVNKLECFIS
jgi:hypothetical protein